MIHQLSLLCMIVAVSYAQRSPYAGRPVDYPGVLPRFTTPSEPSSINALENRFGVTSSSLPGSLYDEDMIKHVSKWPKEKQPFWYLNAEQIAAHRKFSTNRPKDTTTKNNFT